MNMKTLLASLLLPAAAIAMRLASAAALLPVVPEGSDAAPIPLIRAAAAGDDAEVRALLRRGDVDVDVRDELENTPLHWAGYSGHVSTVDTLLALGADVHAANRSGATPLHEASKWGSAAVVAALIDAGADVRAEDVREWTPRDVAAHHNNDAAATVLDGAWTD